LEVVIRNTREHCKGPFCTDAKAGPQEKGVPKERPSGPEAKETERSPEEKPSRYASIVRQIGKLLIKTNEA